MHECIFSASTTLLTQALLRHLRIDSHLHGNAHPSH